MPFDSPLGGGLNFPSPFGGNNFGPELITNGGFDTVIPPWTHDAGTSASVSSGVANVTTTTSNHNFLQQITVEPGKNYRFKFFARRGTMSALKFSVFDLTNIANIIAATLYVVGTSVLEEVIVDFTAPSGCVSANVYMIRDSGVTGTVFFDNASVREIL